LIAGLHQYELSFHPLDLGRQSKEEVLLFEHRSLWQRYSVKLNSLANRPRPDILITGNHAMRNFQGTDYLKNLGFFNFVIDDPSIFEELDLLKALERIDRLPKKLMIYTIEAHGGRRRLEGRNQKVFSAGSTARPFNFYMEYLRRELLWFLGYKTYLDALFSLFGENNVIEYANCVQAYTATKKGGNDLWLAIRSKLSEYLTGNISLNSGLLTEWEYCQNVNNFNVLSTTALARNGGHLATRNSELTYDPGENHPVLTPSEAAASAIEVADGMRQLEEFASENGFRMIYLIPPRYMLPLNDPKDEVSNLVFEKNPDFTVIDFRRFSLEKKYYVDHLHLAEEFGEILAPCLDKILNSETPLPSQPTVNSRGRTMC